MSVRSSILKAAYRLSSCSLQGDIVPDGSAETCDVSCIINFYGRIDLLEGILWSLAEQDLPKQRFEVILVEDRGGTPKGRAACESFAGTLNIRYAALTSGYGKMGHSRNEGLALARGRYVLFLDDDTVILQKAFLSSLSDNFRISGADAIVPRGAASYSLLRGRYSYHEPFFPTSRCMAYTREVLHALGGFVSDIVGQEDVEFVIRFLAAGRAFLNAEQLQYYHPPLIVASLKKPAAVGYSFFRLRKRYPLLLFPVTVKWRMQGKFGLGFAIGIFNAVTGRTARYQ
jgi:glycosyltransferase involved in cell wall biosynthesis